MYLYEPVGELAALLFQHVNPLAQQPVLRPQALRRNKGVAIQGTKVSPLKEQRVRHLKK
jgi:hypothetical protein